MSTWAEKMVDKPTAAISDLVESVQKAADETQSDAYRYEDGEDGSRLEIRCAPNPVATGLGREVLPDADAENHGLLVRLDDGTVVRSKPIVEGEYEYDDDGAVIAEPEVVGFEWRESQAPYLDRLGEHRLIAHKPTLR